MRRLVVRGVIRGVVWVGGGGRRCRVWGPVMEFLVAVAGGGTGGGVCRRGCVVCSFQPQCLLFRSRVKWESEGSVW